MQIFDNAYKKIVCLYIYIIYCFIIESYVFIPIILQESKSVNGAICGFFL